MTQSIQSKPTPYSSEPSEVSLLSILEEALAGTSAEFATEGDAAETVYALLLYRDAIMKAPSFLSSVADYAKMTAPDDSNVTSVSYTMTVKALGLSRKEILRKPDRQNASKPRL